MPWPCAVHARQVLMLHSCLCVVLLVCRWLPPQLEEFDRQSNAKLGDMTAADVALLLEAFKAYGHAPSREWLRGFAGERACHMHGSQRQRMHCHA